MMKNGYNKGASQSSIVEMLVSHDKESVIKVQLGGSIVKSIITEKHISEIRFYITKIVGCIAAVLLQILYYQ